MAIRKLIVLGLMAFGVWGASSCASGGGGSGVCGDRTCDPGEDYVNCSTDCPLAVCGNGNCEATESSITCPQDCIALVCPNGICDIGENGSTCPADCAGAICGNALCEASENTVTCPVDCYCPNNTCDTGESAATCPADCGGGTCGNNICEATETSVTCPADCPSNPVCGDGTCDAGETPASCPADCDISCTDPVCDLYPSCGCSGGQKCSLDSANNNACMTAGSTSAGGACTGDADCAAGTFCLARNNAGTQGACLSWCDPNTQAGCTASTSYCLELTSGGTPIPGAGVCSLTCQPHNPSSACPSGFSCEIYTHNITQVTFTDCHADTGSGIFGSECDPTNGPYCAVGYGCFNDGPPSHCYQWCVPGSSCSFGSCDTAAFSPPLSVGGTTYGVCR